MQRPHFLVGSVGVQFAAIGGGDDEGERIAAAVVIDVLQSVAQFLVRLKIIEQTRVGVYLFQAKSQCDAGENYGGRQKREAPRPKPRWRFCLHQFALAWHGPAQKRRIHQVSANECHY